MKEKTNKIEKLMLIFKSGIERFPITVIFILATYILNIIQLEMLFGMKDVVSVTAQGKELAANPELINYNYINEMLRVCRVAIPVSFMIEILREIYYQNYNKKIFRSLSFVGTLLSMFLMNKIIINEVKYYFLGILAILVSLLIIVLHRKEDGEKYIQTLASDLSVAGIYTIALNSGLLIILTVIDILLTKINYRFYGYVSIFVWLVFGLVFFLSKIKKINVNLDEYNFNKIFEILIKFIIIPLIIMYTGILYIYLCKILIQMKIPNGIISHLTIWYIAFSLIIIILVTPMAKIKDKVFYNYIKYFPYFSLPLLAFALFSIFERISQYGVTKNRYYITALVLWLMFCMLLYIVKKWKNKLAFTIGSLIIVVVIALYSPINAQKIGIQSQLKELKKLFVFNEMLVDGKLVKTKKEISKRDKNRIYTILEYLKDSEVRFEKVDFFKDKNGKEYENVEKMKEDLGIDYDWQIFYYDYENSMENYEGPKDKTYIIKKIDTENIVNGIVEPKGYENVVYVSGYISGYVSANKYVEAESDKFNVTDVKKTDEKRELKISDKNEEELIKIDLNSIVREVLNSDKIKNVKNTSDSKTEEKYEIPSEDFVYEGENDKIKYRIEFLRITEHNVDYKELFVSYNLLFSKK